MASDAIARKLDCETAVDRISNLHGNLIDLILKRLPIHVAAQMSVLSKTWRNIWVTNPYLVFDSAFFSKLVSKMDKKTELIRIISFILLAHRGPISKFLLCIPLGLPFHRCRDMNLWIKNLSKNRVRELELRNQTRIPYNVSSHLFSCLKLTQLTLVGCTLNPPDKFEGFCNLINVELVDVEITAGMLFGAQVKILKLVGCIGVEHLGHQFKYSNNFTDLCIVRSREIDLDWFRCMQNLTFYGLVVMDVDDVTNSKNENINLDKLLGNMPMISTLCLCGSFLESLEPCEAVLKRPMTTLEDLHLVDVGFDNLVLIKNVLCLIKSSPNLQKLDIRLDSKLDSSDEDSKLDSSDDTDLLDWMVLWGDMKLEQLEIIGINGMVGSRTEFQFIKLLLASAPLLELIELDNLTLDDPYEDLWILRELVQFPRASPAAQIKWNSRILAD